jgi:tetratricopeptide (TPR) repeat protein
VIRTAAATVVAIGLASLVPAQHVDGYLALARQYAAGDGVDAEHRLAAWSRGDVTAAAGAAAVTASARDLIAAAMLHTDLANLIIDVRPDDARFHINTARGALTVASGRIGQREHLEPLVRRWSRLVASIYTSSDLLPQASEQVHLGLLRFPEDAGLYVAGGVILEVAVRKQLLADWRRDDIHGAVDRQTIKKTLGQAEVQFRRALALDPHSAEAHLHLGWVRSFLDEAGAATDLDAAIADAQDDRLRYLAHLFRGGLAERQRHFDDARREYDLAREIGPEYQTSYAALSRVEQALGHDTRASELALTGLQVDKRDADDPWWDHRIGFDRESLNWLRREVRRPQ